MLLILGSCIYDAPVVDQVENEADDTYLSFRSTQITLPDNGTGTSVESITLNTLRILVFSKATGQIVTNEVFDISNRPVATKVGSNWVIDFSGIAVATKPGLSVVYVVLNEDVSAVGSLPLTTALNSLTNLAGMQALVNTPLSYAAPLRVTYQPDGITPNEPPFVMSTFDELDILPARPSTNPNLADLRGPSEGQKGFELDRTMAKVTIESVSNIPYVGGPTTDNVQTSYIFILKMGLVKVPQSYLWSPNRLQTNPPVPPTSTYPVPPYTESYQALNFPLPDPNLNYYDRDWDGNIKLDFTASTYEMQEAKKSRIWYTGDASGSNAFSSDSSVLDYNIRTKPGINSSVFFSTYNNDISQIVPVDLNSGNFTSFVNAVYGSSSDGDYLPSIYKILTPQITPNVTGGNWTLKEKNISYYVPENILVNKSDTVNSTKLYVKAVKATVAMPESIVEGDFTLTSQSWGNWIYSTQAGGTNIGTLGGNEFKLFMRTLWRYKLDTIMVGTESRIIVRHYWEGLIRYRQGSITGTIEDAEFQNIASGTNVKNFYLPIKNTPETSVDYNIYRNHEYKFSVHVLQQWAPPAQQAVNNSSASTRSGDVTNSDASWNMVLKMNP